jgi:HAD superfamily hydrolase (TIGR01459 family)
MSPTPRPRKVLSIAGLGEIADRYDAILCDVWGVLHNGQQSFRPASDALVAFRRRGGAVVLLTNAPRPSRPIREQVLALGVSPDAFDAVVTSGDVTVALIAERAARPVHHIGPPRDLSLFEAAEARIGIKPALASLERADYVLCTGLFDDDVETPEDYEDRLLAMAARGLPFICANPDLVVHRGSTLIYCAGALARRYEELGGKTIYAGKPYAPIYRAAIGVAETALGRPVEPARTLAIGDALRTDVAGALRQGLDALFISAGIHHGEVHGEGGRGAAENLEVLFAREKVWPFATARVLAP